MELHEIPKNAVALPGRVRLGSMLSGLVSEHGGVELEVQRSSDSAEPLDLG